MTHFLGTQAFPSSANENLTVNQSLLFDRLSTLGFEKAMCCFFFPTCLADPSQQHFPPPPQILTCHPPHSVLGFSLCALSLGGGGVHTSKYHLQACDFPVHISEPQPIYAAVHQTVHSRQLRPRPVRSASETSPSSAQW